MVYISPRYGVSRGDPTRIRSVFFSSTCTQPVQCLTRSPRAHPNTIRPRHPSHQGWKSTPNQGWATFKLKQTLTDPEVLDRFRGDSRGDPTGNRRAEPDIASRCRERGPWKAPSPPPFLPKSHLDVRARACSTRRLLVRNPVFLGTPYITSYSIWLKLGIACCC